MKPPVNTTGGVGGVAGGFAITLETFFHFLVTNETVANTRESCTGIGFVLHTPQGQSRQGRVQIPSLRIVNRRDVNLSGALRFLTVAWSQGAEHKLCWLLVKRQTMGILPSTRFLTPGERVAEILFGLIMVLTFTGSLSVAAAGRGEVRTMLIGALGCNIAWGIIDAVFYLMNSLAEKGHGIRAWRAANGAASPEAVYKVIDDALPPVIAKVLTSPDYEILRLKLQMTDSPEYPRLVRNDWFAALMVFFWVFITTFPVAIPFLIMQDVHRALRVSNAIAILLLFVAGYVFGRCVEYKPGLSGLFMVVLGSGLVFLTMALGG